jgi:hypothetical protein
MTRIITTRYHYKRRPRKRAKAAVIEVPEIATVKRPKPGVPAPRTKAAALATVAASDDRKPAIVTIRRQPAKILPPGLLPDTPAEYQRRGDAADALWRELVRHAAGERP